ncbi:MAG TPA: DUF1572 family protein [Candidatus Angelobacter sp.]|nr:DUF1572 family protein [Candidatus Angelobacter sp.]
MADETSTAKAYLDESFRTFRGYKRMADAALAQISNEEFFRLLDPESNSLALIVKHMAGNLRSRWTDFLTSDGEKPDRHRDQEFELTSGDTREDLMRRWERGWEITFNSIQSLKPQDLLKTVTIRAEPHTVLQAISRSVTHMAHHIGQIVFLAKHLRGSDWKTLSIPRGKTAEFNAMKLEDRKVKSPARS